jgi:hypothetical protein
MVSRFWRAKSAAEDRKPLECEEVPEVVNIGRVACD